jgi:MFS family permease
MMLMTAAIVRETYRPLLLERRVKRLRREKENKNLVSALAPPYSDAQAFKRSLLRPVRLLLFSPIVLFPSLGLGVVFGIFFLMLTTMATVFQNHYNFSVGSSGLVYLGSGLGLIFALLVFGMTSDRAYKAIARTGTPKPEIRLAPIGLGAPLACAGLLIYGWGIEKHIHWILPIMGAAIFCMGLIAFLMPVGTYLIEVFNEYSASATGALAFCRSITGAVLPLCAGKLYDRLGLGWGSTLLALISLAFAPLPWLFYKNGERLRTRYPIDP